MYQHSSIKNLKIVLTGTRNAGRTTLVNYKLNTASPAYPTTGMQISTIKLYDINQQLITCELRDISGEPAYRQFREIYVCRAQIELYLITTNDLSNLTNVIPCSLINQGKETLKVVVINQFDSFENFQLQNFLQYIDAQAIPCYLCNSKTGANINELFSEVIQAYLDMQSDEFKHLASFPSAIHHPMSRATNGQLLTAYEKAKWAERQRIAAEARAMRYVKAPGFFLNREAFNEAYKIKPIPDNIPQPEDYNFSL